MKIFIASVVVMIVAAVIFIAVAKNTSSRDYADEACGSPASGAYACVYPVSGTDDLAIYDLII